MSLMVGEGLKQVQQLVPLLSLQNPQLKPLESAATDIKHTVKDKTVVISTSLSGEAIEKVLKGGKQ